MQNIPADIPLAARLSAVSAVDDPKRRAILTFVRHSAEPVGRDDVAEQFSLPRSTAAFHLDRLADEHLVEVVYQRRTGRTGPGAGRPAKMYRGTAREVSVSIPERRYDLAAKLLAAAVENSATSGRPVAEALADTAAEHGRRWAESAGTKTLSHLLESTGFEPRTEADGTVVLGNCPFHRLVVDHPETTCTMNLHLLRGAARNYGIDPEALALEPAEGRCCVTYRPGTPS